MTNSEQSWIGFYDYLTNWLGLRRRDEKSFITDFSTSPIPYYFLQHNGYWFYLWQCLKYTVATPEERKPGQLEIVNKKIETRTEIGKSKTQIHYDTQPITIYRNHWTFKDDKEKIIAENTTSISNGTPGKWIVKELPPYERNKSFSEIISNWQKEIFEGISFQEELDLLLDNYRTKPCCQSSVKVERAKQWLKNWTKLITKNK